MKTTTQDLLTAARVLLRAPCRNESASSFVGAGTKLAVISDEASEELADALLEACRELRGVGESCSLDTPGTAEVEGPRPHKVLPLDTVRALQGAGAVVYVARALPAEWAMRQQLRSYVLQRGLRHAHLPDITQTAFVRGLSSEIEAVVTGGHVLVERLKGVRSVAVASAQGTALTLTFADGIPWIPRLGEIVVGESVGFPAGHLIGSPESVDGVFVANASLGEFFGAREGLLADRPVRFTLEKGHVMRVEAASRELEADLSRTLSIAANSNRVGAVVVGANQGIAAPTGEVVVDQNRPGLHLIIGSAPRRSFGMTWSARTSFTACQSDCRVTFDGEVVIEHGRFVCP